MKVPSIWIQYCQLSVDLQMASVVKCFSVNYWYVCKITQSPLLYMKKKCLYRTAQIFVQLLQITKKNL